MYRFGFFERLYGHHIGLMYFGLFVFRLQVQVCQGVVVLSCIVIRPTLPSELAIILDGTSSNPLEPHPDGRSSNLRLKDLPRARLEPATQWVTSGLPTTVLFPPPYLLSMSPSHSKNFVNVEAFFVRFYGMRISLSIKR